VTSLTFKFDAVDLLEKKITKMAIIPFFCRIKQNNFAPTKPVGLVESGPHHHLIEN
jgi:hypothetical protein